METCDICTLTFHEGQCPNGWRPRSGVMTARSPEQHTAARTSITRYRAVMAHLTAA